MKASVVRGARSPRAPFMGRWHPSTLLWGEGYTVSCEQINLSGVTQPSTGQVIPQVTPQVAIDEPQIQSATRLLSMGLQSGSAFLILTVAMERSDIEYLFYIAPIENLQSILTNGILCHNEAKKINHQSIALPEVQERRRNKVIPNGGRLHDYVNLYINPRNPMMYRLKERHKELCIVRVDSLILDEPGVVISDRNAAKQYARFDRPDQGIERIDKERISARYWTHGDDPMDEERHKGEMCAEVLVPKRIDPKYIRDALVSCAEGKDKLKQLCPQCKTKIDADRFFA